MPVCPTASTIAAVVSFAASYLTCSRWPTRSAETRFEPGERLEPALEDDDLLVAVHALDAEYRFRVELAGGAGRVRRAAITRGPPAVLLHVAQALPEQREHVPVVERVEDHPALPARPNDARVPQQAELVGDGGFGDAELLREVADAQLRRARARRGSARGSGSPSTRKISVRPFDVRGHRCCVTYEQLVQYIADLTSDRGLPSAARAVG